MATDWEIRDRIRNRWEIHGILKGGMGIVYVVYDHEWREAFAAKTFQDEVFASNPDIADRFTQEALAWVNLDVHQNVTQARFVEKIEGKPFLFLEYVSGGDLGGWIGTPRLTEDLPQVLLFAIQFCDGMIHANSKGIKAHRDIKPQNCLVTQDNVLKVTDFGLAKVFDDTREGEAPAEPMAPQERRPPAEATPNPQGLGIGLSRTGTAAGTCTHMAPEQFDDVKHVDVRADIYSFGVMLFQMLTGRLPFVGRTRQQLERLHKTQPPPPPTTSDRSVRHHSPLTDVIQTCLAKDPTQRFADFGTLREQLGAIYEKLTGEPARQPVVGANLHAVEWNNKGASLANLGQHEEAIASFDRAIEINPRLELAWHNKGGALHRLGRTEEAIACYDRALQINLRYADAWSNKGVALGALGRMEEAIACYDGALEINPRHADAWNNKGAALGALGWTEEEIASYDHALEINPRHADAWSNKSTALGTLGRREEEIACYDRALEINPRLEKAWADKGVALGALGRMEEAIACCDRALTLNPRLEQVWSDKGGALGTLGRMEEAIACYERALEINPRLEQAWYSKGAAVGALGRTEEAIECFDRTIGINPRHAEGWANKGTELHCLGRTEEAIPCLDRALEINPRFAEAWFNKGVAVATMGPAEKAIECFQRALEINPLFAEAWVGRGAMLFNTLQRYRDALASFEEAQRLGHPWATEAIALCKESLGM